LPCGRQPRIVPLSKNAEAVFEGLAVDLACGREAATRDAILRVCGPRREIRGRVWESKGVKEGGGEGIGRRVEAGEIHGQDEHCPSEAALRARTCVRDIRADFRPGLPVGTGEIEGQAGVQHGDRSGRCDGGGCVLIDEREPFEQIGRGGVETLAALVKRAR
jgi:hypothetical protein